MSGDNNPDILTKLNENNNSTSDNDDNIVQISKPNNVSLTDKNDQDNLTNMTNDNIDLITKQNDISPIHNNYQDECTKMTDNNIDKSSQLNNDLITDKNNVYDPLKMDNNIDEQVFQPNEISVSNKNDEYDYTESKTQENLNNINESEITNFENKNNDDQEINMTISPEPNIQFVNTELPENIENNDSMLNRQECKPNIKKLIYKKISITLQQKNLPQIDIDYWNMLYIINKSDKISYICYGEDKIKGISYEFEISQRIGSSNFQIIEFKNNITNRSNKNNLPFLTLISNFIIKFIAKFIRFIYHYALEKLLLLIDKIGQQIKINFLQS